MGMRLYGRIMLVVGALWLPLAVQAGEDDGSKITFNASTGGATVDGTSVDFKYELLKGKKSHDAHVCLDGQCRKGFKGTFTNLPAGMHEIKVAAAIDDQKGLVAESTVTTEVRSGQPGRSWRDRPAMLLMTGPAGPERIETASRR